MRTSNLTSNNISSLKLDPSLMYNVSASANTTEDSISDYITEEDAFGDVDTVTDHEFLLTTGNTSVASDVVTSASSTFSSIFPSTSSSLLSSSLSLSLFTTDSSSTVIVPDDANSTYTDPDLIIRNVSSIACLSQNVPLVREYLTAINVVGVTILTLGALAVLFIMYMYIDTLKHVIKNSSPMAKGHSAFVLSVYPVVAVATYCAIVVPRAHLLAEAMTQGMFMASLYQLFCLFVAYCGGEAELIKKVKPDSLNLKVSPCCCWPCCSVLPRLTVNKKNVRILRLLILQLPVVQGLVYMIMLVMWAEAESLYQLNYMYFQPVILVSILCGIWGITMTMTLLEQTLKDHHMKGKFFVLQFVLLLAKLQGLLARLAVWNNILPCKEPITPTVYANLIYNSSMLWEMIILGAIARKLYKLPIPSETTKMQLPVDKCTVVPCPSSDAFSSEKNNNNNNNNNNNVVIMRF